MESKQELERLRADGHHIDSDRRHHIIYLSPNSIRAAQLYRTIPHEIGHAVDYEHNVERATDKSDDEEALRSLYWSGPSREREAFAHRYAEEFAQDQKGALPFPQNMEVQKLQAQGLNPNWFSYPD